MTMRQSQSPPLASTVPSTAYSLRVFRTTRALQSCPKFEALKVSLNLRLKSPPGPADVGGVPKFLRPLMRDRRRPFPRNKSNLNTKSPRGRGAVKSLRNRDCADRRPSHSEIFFWRRRFSGTSQRSASRTTNPFKSMRSAPSPIAAIYFLRAPGGRSKVCTFRSGTGGPAPRIYPRVSGNYFSGPRRGALENRREIQGGG